MVIGKTVLYHDAQLDTICQNPPFLKEYTGDAILIPVRIGYEYPARPRKHQVPCPHR